MALNMKIDLRMSQKLVMTPMLQQAIKLLPMTRMEMIQSIRAELNENPMLEEVTEEIEESQELSDDTVQEVDRVADTLEAQTEESQTISAKDEPKFEEDSNLEDSQAPQKPDDIEWDAYSQDGIYDGSSWNSSNEKPSIENNIGNSATLEERLLWQLNYSAIIEEEQKFGEIIIGNLDSKGYLEIDIQTIATEHKVDPEIVEDALILVQSFHPSGVAARNLKECLLLQAKNSECKSEIVEELIEHHLEELDERNVNKLAKKLKSDPAKLLEAIKT
ncbi:MAG: hypothetical protein ACN4E2_02215, partial [Nitrospinota bacterium]